MGGCQRGKPLPVLGQRVRRAWLATQEWWSHICESIILSVLLEEYQLGQSQRLVFVRCLTLVLIRPSRPDRCGSNSVYYLIAIRRSPNNECEHTGKSPPLEIFARSASRQETYLSSKDMVCLSTYHNYINPNIDEPCPMPWNFFVPFALVTLVWPHWPTKSVSGVSISLWLSHMSL